MESCSQWNIRLNYESGDDQANISLNDSQWIVATFADSPILTFYSFILYILSPYKLDLILAQIHLSILKHH